MLRQLAKARNLVPIRTAFISGYIKPYVHQFKEKRIENDLESSEVLRQIVKPDFSAYKVQKFHERSEKDKQTHALLIQAEQRRSKLQLYQDLAENQFYLFNIPSETKLKDLRVLFQVQDGLIDLKMHRNGLQQAMFATATFNSIINLEKCKERLQNVWLQDKLLKIKTCQDKEKETFDDRTVAAKGIPINWSEQEIKEHFSQFGHIMGIELPQYDTKIREMRLSEKATIQMKKQEKQRELAFQKALASQRFLWQDYSAQMESQGLMQLMQNELKEQGVDLNQDQVFRDGRKHAIWRAYVTLEAEKAQIQIAESELEVIRSSIAHSVQKQQESLLSQQEKQNINLVKEDQAQILHKIFTYFKNNPDQIESLSEKIQLDVSLQQLQRLNQQEVALQLDFLLNNLKKREKLVETRLYSVLDDLRKEDRVIFENANYNKELEKVAPISKDPEHEDLELAWPISKQIEIIKERRQVDPKRAFYEIVTAQYNPFSQPNMRPETLDTEMDMSSVGTDSIKYDANTIQPQSKMRETERKLVSPEFLDQFKAYIKNVEKTMDVPFDEIYHREKQVVQEIILAEKELERAQSQLPDVMSEFANPNGLELLQDQALGERHPAEQIRQQAAQQRLANNLGFKAEDESQLDRLLREGRITEKDYDKAVEMQKRQNLQHLGYCFITYTHRDEAIIASAVDHYLNDFSTQKTEVMVKGYLDHQDFDPFYFMQKIKNEGQLEYKRKALRDAKAKLKAFEENFDKEQPQLESLKEFKIQALQLLENAGKDRHFTYRTDSEQAELLDKMRRLQRENKEIDFTVLFQSEKSQQLRKKLHKRAFKTYKEYEFLKAGLIKENVVERKDALKQFKKGEYAFPALEKLASDLFTDKLYAQHLDYGETIDTRGRRFHGYTQEELEQALKGKDGLRLGGNYADYPAIGFNEDFKKRFPKERYLKTEKLDRMNQQLERANDLSRDELGFFNFGKEGPHEEIEYAKNMKLLKNKEGMTMAESQERIQKFKPKDARQQQLKGEMQYKHFTDFLKGRKFSSSNKLTEEQTDSKAESAPEQVQQEKVEVNETQEFSTSDIEKLMSQQDQSQTPQRPRIMKPLFSGTKHREGSKHVPFELRLKENQERNKIPVEFKANYDYKPNEYKDPRSMYYKLYDKGTRSFEEVMKQASIDGFMPEISEKVRRQNYTALEDIENRLLKEKEDDKELLKEKFYRSLSIKAGSEKPEEILAYAHQIKDYVDLQAELDREREEFHDEVETLGANPLLSWAARKRPQTKQKRLQDIAKPDIEQKHSSLYEEYRQKLSQSLGQSKAQEQEGKERGDAEARLLATLKEQAPQAPTLEQYFESRAQGKDPLDALYPDSLAENFTTYSLDDESLFSQEELLGAFYNQTMTSEQFYQWKKHSKNPENFRKMMEDRNRNLFMKQSDIRRLTEEGYESLRRRKVLNGDWSEEESRKKLQEHVQRCNQQLPTARRQRYEERVRHFEKISARKLRNPHELHEREYYFDSGYGESLESHVAKLQQQMPDAKVEVRQDADGLHVVKTSFKKKYKYDLDLFLKGEQRDVKETVDAIFQALMGGDRPDQESLRNLILAKSQQQFALDLQSEEELQNLVLKFQFGGFSSRLQFVEEFRETYARAKFDTSRPVQRDAFAIQSLTGQNINYFTEKLAEKYEKERRIIQQELNEQIMLRLNQFMYFQERKESDFVKLPVSETSLFERQLQAFSVDDLDEQLGDDQTNLTERDLQQLKREIRERREVKQKLLAQKRPNFSNHLYL